MTPKQYQQHSLHWLRRYYQRCRVMQEMGDTFPAATAFTSVTAEIHEGQGLPYAPVKQVPGIPYVCLRIPTGGGKTLVACEAVSLGVRELLQKDRALILWLVPSDTIRSQTLSRLKDGADPYRQTLDTNLGNVAVLDIEEAVRMKRALLDSHTVIVVATMQAFRRRDMSALNVYKNNGELMSHFENLPAELLEVVEREPEGHFQQSLVNVFRIRRPFVIIDEAHNARQPLSFESLRRLNPSAVLELTATPNLKPQTGTEDGETYENPPSNVLHSVSAYALKAEEMIKLPIYLRYREPWDALLGDAIGLLKHLDGEARQEEALTGEHIRPMMLLQAQPEYQGKASITVETVEAKLREFGIHESEVCVHTGTRRGLDGINVQTRESKVRFIITVQALKEGWDCPWAYVLFSVAEMGSSRAVEQILGRVLRMPKAKRKQRADLNNAYAFVASTKFDEAAKALKDGLIASGFEGQDAEELVVERPFLPGVPTETPKAPDAPVTTTLTDKLHQKKVYETLLFGDGSGTVHVTLASVFTFAPAKYPVGDCYLGLELPRHYYREIGAMNAEEVQCAQVIAHDPRIECWVRNLEREPRCSFWIQTSTDKFYPDFVAKLTNGKLLAVEYKGAHLAETPDTKEKERLGKLWQERSSGQCFFEMVKGPRELGKVPEAIKKTLA